MDSFTRQPGDPYPYCDLASGKWFWKTPGSPVTNGPFLTFEDACDDIVAYNAARADRIIGIAKVCHEYNRAFCAFIGDNSQKPWEEAPGWQRDSAISGVKFHIANPDAGDSASHDNWCKDKIADGWVYGPVKDEVAKTHHCLVSFEELPLAQQMKDRLFRTTVHNLWSLEA